MQDRYHYIAVFDYSGESIGVYFPDLPGCISGGDSTEEALKMSKESLCLHLYGMEKDKDYIPVPSDLKDITLDKNEVAVLVDIYMKPFREKMNTKFIKKTLSIPNWLNSIAEEKGVNFSAILQDALKQRLHLE